VKRRGNRAGTCDLLWPIAKRLSKPAHYSPTRKLPFPVSREKLVVVVQFGAGERVVKFSLRQHVGSSCKS
jgi:hypothetical protein